MKLWETIDGMMFLAQFGRILKSEMLVTESKDELDKSFNVTQSVCDSAFKASYRNKDTLTLFKQHVEEIYSLWNPDTFYSPYCALVAASMMGKSRMLCQLPEVGLFLFLVCFRNKTLTGTPPRTPLVADYIEVDSQKFPEVVVQFRFFDLIVQCVEHLGQWLLSYDHKNNNHTVAEKRILFAKHWFLYQRTGKNLQLIEVGAVDQSFSPKASRFWDKIIKNIRDFTEVNKPNLADIYKEAIEHLEEALGTVKKGLQLHGIYSEEYYKSCIVFGFDEAKTLISKKVDGDTHTIFHVIRRTFVFVPKAEEHLPPIVAVFTDTTSSVSNFAPSKPWDKSARTLTKGMKLFDPYSSLCTLDIFDDEAEPAKALSSLEKGYTKYGRPAFHAMTELVNEEQKHSKMHSDLLSVIEAKIRGGKLIQKSGSLEALAILGVLVPLDVNPSHVVASQLVASNMRYCAGISQDRDSVFTLQPPEPAMALAGLSLIVKAGWDTVLNLVSQNIGLALTNIGYKGELGIQIACITASSKCMDLKPGLWKPMRLDSYLEIFIGPDSFSRAFPVVQDNPFLKNKIVRLGQFVQFHSYVNTKTLLDYFNRGCGILCQTGNKGCDLIIPVFDDVSGNHQTLLEEKRMTCVAIQVNYLAERAYGKKYMKHVTTSLTPANSNIFGIDKDLTYLSLYMDMSKNPKRTEVFDVPGINQHKSISLIGYDIKHMFDTKKAESINNSFFHMLNKVNFPHDNIYLPKRAKANHGAELKMTYRK
jgi:hypothetical protein